MHDPSSLPAFYFEPGKCERLPMPFPNIGERRTFQLGARHVAKADPKIHQLVRSLGLIEFELDGEPFESLVEAIISQQLNGQSARSIFKRLKSLVQSDVIDAENLSKVSVSQLRYAGVSPQKIRYLRDLSSRVVRGQLNLDSLKTKPDGEVIGILDEVKGIGPWTAQMFLIFTLGRPDVLPVDDLGLQAAVRKVYSLRKLPTAEKMERIAHDWHPYCSVASLYLWRSNSTN
jgi:DNA-3-methyladenine glycosylase II